MTLAPRGWAAELLHYWFETLAETDWFGGGGQLDQELSRRFSRELAMLAGQPASRFLTDPQTALAAVVLFDQIPRNIHRGTPQAFATDSLARAITRGALRMGYDRRLPTAAQRQFLAMPLMHSEAIANQRLSLAVFCQLGVGQSFSFARQHHAMIARFGRFPHRNDVLGRVSSDAERRAVPAGFAW